MSNTARKTKPPWRLLVKKGGKEIEAGRFETDFLAFRFVEDYGLTEWRITGPDGLSIDGPEVPVA